RQANAEIARGKIGDYAVILAKPRTYMNLSGQSVGALARYYKVPHDRLLIVYDDIALPLGTIRIRGKGSSGGHNGMNSIIQHVGPPVGFRRRCCSRSAACRCSPVPAGRAARRCDRAAGPPYDSGGSAL